MILFEVLLSSKLYVILMRSSLMVSFVGLGAPTTIWQLSGAKNIVKAIVKREGNDFKGWLLGDSGYAQREIMMLPLLDEKLTTKQKRYDEAHKKCSYTVERAIAVLKSRFRCLCKKTGGAIMYHESIDCDIIMSNIVFHNYCRDRNIEYGVDNDVKEIIRREVK